VCVFHEQSTLVTIGYLYHPALLISVPIFENNEPINYNDTVYDYVHFVYNSIRSSLAKMNWNLVLNGLHINDTVNIFYCNVFKIIDGYCNKKTYLASKHPIWVSSFLRDLIYEKKITHVLFKKTPSNQITILFPTYMLIVNLDPK
jgi:hypothetical protein